MLRAIESGIITDSTKQRLEDLESQKKRLEDALSAAELKNPLLSREQISVFVYRFRGLDTEEILNRQLTIDSFINSIYLYDDKIVLTYNYNNLTDTVSLLETDDILEKKSSDKRKLPLPT